MNVRSYTDADLEAVAVVFTSSVHVLAASAYDETQCRAWAPQAPDLHDWRRRLRHLQTFVAVEGAEVAGFISYAPNGHIELLYVAPSTAGVGWHHCCIIATLNVRCSLQGHSALHRSESRCKAGL
jgi:putative acetyltransferase